MKRLINLLEPVIPARWTGYLDHVSKHKKFFFPYGGPMNGQTARLEIVRELVEFCGVDRIIETGTFRGTTTEWFSSLKIPVISIEAIPRFAEFVRVRLRKQTHVEIRIGNSVDCLKAIVAAKQNLGERTLFYLDAHWYDYLPLRDEYDLICENFAEPIIVVDDFQVPDDPGYGYDDYGPDMALTLDYLLQGRSKLPHIFFPVTNSRWETGARRGCVVLTPDESIASMIEARLPLLRPWRREA